MKHLYTYGLSLIVASSMAMATSISTTAPGYTTPSEITLNIEGVLSGDQDWVGIYKKGSTNDWNNVLGWSWVNNETAGLSIDTIIDNGGYSGRDILLDGGDFEARLFFHNSYASEASTPFYMTRAGIPDLLIVNPMYQVGDTPQVSVNTILSGDQDWVGIYPINSDNSWSNVIAWNWVESNGIVDINRAISGKELLAGEYEARLFFHNSYTVEASNNFFVSDAQSAISTTKDTYAVNELVAINIDTALSGDQDWVGIFPKNSDNSWGNVLGWNWVENGSNILSENNASLPAGEYEIRLFFHNEYGANAVARASYGFTVVGEAPVNVYGEEGPYLNNVKINNNSDKYVVYYPEGHVQNAPLVLVLGYDNTVKGDDNHHRLEGVMKYMASLGCYVVGHKKIIVDDWHDLLKPEKRPAYFIDAITEASALGVNTNNLVVVGKSTGGMNTYALMKYFKNQGLGTQKRLLIDLMGWYALDMNKNDLETLNVDALIFQYGGKTGEQTKYTQDPRTLITISKILKRTSDNVGFITIDSPNHSYEGGTYDEFKTKNDLMKPIDAMIKYEFFNNDGKYNDARAILFDGYDRTVQDSYDATIQFLDGGTSRSKYGDYRCFIELGIDYCNDHGLQ